MISSDDFRLSAFGLSAFSFQIRAAFSFFRISGSTDSTAQRLNDSTLNRLTVIKKTLMNRALPPHYYCTVINIKQQTLRRRPTSQDFRPISALSSRMRKHQRSRLHCVRGSRAQQASTPILRYLRNERSGDFHNKHRHNRTELAWWSGAEKGSRCQR